MKILSIGLDSKILDKNSDVSGRVIEYGKLVERYDIVVPYRKKVKLKISNNINAYGSGGKNKIIQFFKLYFLASKKLKKEKYDVITVQDYYFIALVAYFLKLKYKAGLEIQVHGFEKYFGIRKIIAKFLIPRADSIRVVSKRLKEKIIKDFKVKEDKIINIPIYVKIGEYKKNNFKENNDKIIFLSAGRFVKVKNIEMQIEAMSANELRQENCELWIVGEGKFKNKYEELIKKFKLKDKVKIFKWQDLSSFYKKADIFLLSSDYEGWGMVVVEAASFGLPVIMTNVGCAGEVIVDNKSGFVSPVGDKKRFKEKMLELMKNKEKIISMGDEARKAVEKLPNKEETLKLYKKSWMRAVII
jgi:glycosyltransferase involved in cell wall biosynthesis